jgi:hypothetical protein
MVSGSAPKFRLGELETTLVTSEPTAALSCAPILRRVGTPPTARGSATAVSCADIFELTDGKLAVVGTNRTDEMKGGLQSIVVP